MPQVSVSAFLGEDRSRSIKKATFYLVAFASGVVLLSVIYTIYEFSNAVCFDCVDRYGRKAEDKMPWYYYGLPVFTLIGGRAWYKYNRMRSRMRAMAAFYGAPTEPEIAGEVMGPIPFQIERRGEPGNEAEIENFRRQETQAMNREYSEMQRWVEQELTQAKAKLSELERENLELRTQLGGTKPSVTEIGYQRRPREEPQEPIGRMRRATMMRKKN